MRIRIVTLLLLALFGSFAQAQNPVTLDDCQQWAREAHPLLKQKDLYRQMSELKLDNIQAAYLPQIDLKAQATYQSDVTHVGISLPNMSIPSVSKDQYKAYVDVKQNIWDGGITKARNELEKVQEQTNQQSVEVELYQVKDQVNRLFFASFLIQKNMELLAKKSETLEARKSQLVSAVQNGIKLQSDIDQVDAELIRTKQQRTELQTALETTLSALAILTGKQESELQQLEVGEEKAISDEGINRPENELFSHQQAVLDASADLSQKARNPKLFGFGQAGYGRPGLNMLNDDFDTYYMVGVGMNWTVFDWKQTKRNKEVMQLQQELVKTQEERFERNINLALDGEKRQMAKLSNLLDSDRDLIGLQERITQSSASKLENGTITTADYLQDLNAEMAARITFETHKVQLEAAKINYRNLLGKQ